MFRTFPWSQESLAGNLNQSIIEEKISDALVTVKRKVPSASTVNSNKILQKHIINDSGNMGVWNRYEHDFSSSYCGS